MFKNSIQNVLIDEIITGFDTFQPQNVGHLNTRGWEFEVYVQLSKNFTLRSGYNLAFIRMDQWGNTSGIS